MTQDSRGAPRHARAIGELRRRDERLRLITDALPELVACFDRGLCCVFLNRACEDWLGQTRTEVLGRPLREAFGESAYAGLREPLDEASLGRAASFRLRVPRPGRGARTLVGSALAYRNGSGEVDGFVLLMRETDETLGPEAPGWRVSRRAARLGSWEWDLRSGRMRWSDDVHRILGVPPEEAASWASFLQRVHPDDRERVRTELEGCAREGRTCRLEHRIARPDGIVRLVSQEAEPGSGAPVLTGTLVDITERRRGVEETRRLNAEMERRVAERTAELEEANAQLNAFAYSVSHDLRAPLRAMQGFSQALLEDYLTALPGPAQEYVRRISEASRRMDALINDLLDYSRLARAEVDVEAVPLEPLVERLLRDLAGDLQARGALVRVVRPLPAVYGQPMILSQVIGNLVSNAVKFVEAGVPPRVVIRAEESGRRARVWVEDNGIGIAPEHQGRIFRVFERLHSSDAYPGTGVGLAIVRKGIQRMGGRVGLESAPGAGSRFWFELAHA